ncbi:hypothetical protein REPUB_Repub06bG0054400 [Reevesia pubescens]
MEVSFELHGISHKVGIAAVAHDYNGHILDGTHALIQTSSISMAKALVIRLGSSLILRKEWSNVILENDDAELVKRLVFYPGENLRRLVL